MSKELVRGISKHQGFMYKDRAFLSAKAALQARMSDEVRSLMSSHSVTYLRYPHPVCFVRENSDTLRHILIDYWNDLCELESK